MPTCRNCKKTISKQDRDLCPYCGIPHPVDKDYKTQDITEFIDPISGEYKLYESKKRKTAVILSIFLGVFGASFFYLKKNLAGIISLVVSLILLAIGITLSVLVWPCSVIFFILVDYLVHIGYGIYLAKNHSAKDGNGEFLR